MRSDQPSDIQENNREELLTPIRSMRVLVIVTGIFVVWLSWTTYKHHLDAEAIGWVGSRLHVLEREIVRLSEMRRLSAKAAATSGSIWEKRHRMLTSVLDAIAEEAHTFLSHPTYNHYLTMTGIANRGLIEIENKAIDLGRAGRIKEAQSLLASTTYNQKYRVYIQGLGALAAGLRSVGGELRYSQVKVTSLQVLIVFILTPMLIVGWVLVLKSIGQWQSELFKDPLLVKFLENPITEFDSQPHQAVQFVHRDIGADQPEGNISVERGDHDQARMKEQVKRLSEEVANLQKSLFEAEVATRAKSDFLASMSHEIRTPMTAILGYSDILMEENESRTESLEPLEALETIQRNGQHLLTIINDVLDLSKIEAGEISIEQIECSPRQILDDVLALMRQRTREKKITLDVEYVGAVPDTIRTDPTRLRQILMNLVSNAVKFTVDGGVRVIVKMINRFDQGAARIRFEVIDTGIGIREDQLTSVFDTFAQADTSMTRKFGGTGLGLAISKQLAQLLGGDITVASEYGAGSTFAVVIQTEQLDDVTMVKDANEIKHQNETNAKQQEKVDIQLNGRILLAEDGLDNQRLISFILRKAGADVTVAEDGLRAYEKVMVSEGSDERYDIILMDMKMSQLDGYGATRQLRESGCTIPIIALTANAMSGDREKCLEAGCTDFATKPIDKKSLFEMINRYMHQQDQIFIAPG